MCGGFSCSKNALAALNVLYILVSFILIGVAAYAKAMAMVTSLALVGGIIACGVFLLLIAIIGLVGAVKHHQVLLFFYMLILFLLFLVQFSISCACLAVNEAQQQQIAQAAWKIADDDAKMKIQEVFMCCGFDQLSQNLPANDSMSHPDCLKIGDCANGNDKYFCCDVHTGSTDSCPVSPCFNSLRKDIQTAFKISGGIGLFFSFTEILGVWLTVRYRNQRDPKSSASAFLS